MIKHKRWYVVSASAVTAVAATAVLAGGSVASAANCTPLHKFKTVTPGKLTVGLVTALPYGDVQNGAFIGVDGRIVTAIAKLECLKLNVQIVSGAAAIPDAESGRVDVTAGGWYRTPQRAKVIGQTITAWYDFSAVASKGGTVTSVNQLVGKQVGVVEGSLFVAPLQSVIGAGNVHLYQTTDAIWADIAAGRIQYTVDGSAAASYAAKQKASLGFKVERLAPTANFSPSQSAGEVNYPHSKSNTKLGAALNADITKLRGNGTVKAALKAWGLTNPSNFSVGSGA